MLEQMQTELIIQVLLMIVMLCTSIFFNLIWSECSIDGSSMVNEKKLYRKVGFEKGKTTE